jgi:hypothetical protein
LVVTKVKEQMDKIREIKTLLIAPDQALVPRPPTIWWPIQHQKLLVKKRAEEVALEKDGPTVEHFCKVFEIWKHRTETDETQKAFDALYPLMRWTGMQTAVQVNYLQSSVIAPTVLDIVKRGAPGKEDGTIWIRALQSHELFGAAGKQQKQLINGLGAVLSKEMHDDVNEMLQLKVPAMKIFKESAWWMMQLEEYNKEAARLEYLESCVCPCRTFLC